MQHLGPIRGPTVLPTAPGLVDQDEGSENKSAPRSSRGKESAVDLGAR